MTQDGREIVPNPGHGLFASGVVLGLSVGLAVGHLLLFARGGRDLDPAAHTEVLLSTDPPAGLFHVDESPSASEGLLTTLEFDRQDDVGRVTLSDQAPGEHLHFFPEAMRPTTGDDPELDDTKDTQATVLPGPLRMTADVTPETDPPPQALDPPAATPIDQRTSRREQLARSIIADELPDATDQQREVWYEVLQGLPAEDIKGILRMRKHIGPQEPSALSALLSTPLSLELQDPVQVEPGTSPTLPEADASAAQQLRQIEAHNLANRDTVAYKRQVPVIVEASTNDEGGVRLCRVIRDMRQGELQPTQRSLDLAIVGRGFLQVRCGDEVRYTRDGRLTLDDQGQLMLLAATECWRLDPQLTIPAQVIDITISAAGEVQAVLSDGTESSVGRIRIVQFINPQALQVEAGGLYQAVPSAGAPCAANQAGTSLTVELAQFHLERSNVAAGSQSDQAHHSPAPTKE